MATCLRGWALGVQGDVEQGIAHMQQGLTAWRTLGIEVFRPFLHTLLADVYRRAAQVKESLRVIEETLLHVDRTGARVNEAELHRLKGELLLQHTGPDTSQAETCFYKALNVAQSQHAKSWELRAAMSLARLWQAQDKRQEAYDLLAPVYEWFTEGFGTADLTEAQALLEEL